MTGNMTGRVLSNRYQITERIGIGGMAEVYRAQDNVLGRLVAVKVMLPQYAADPNFTQRFKQEAAAAANLQSPYIVNVYDWGQDEGTYYIVMEYVRGSDLKTAILQRGAINQRKVAEIGLQVCQALSVAHKLDIIHRDIKPQNIMVQPDGNVKVMDFGIARAKNSVMTQTSSVLGTAHYISPEQAQGKELTATSDIYSLGIVLYEAATGQLPFDGPDAVNVALQQVNDLPVPPRAINPDIDPAFEAIIMKAMEKNPADRFVTAGDMRLVLNDYLAGRPVNLGGFSGAETMVMGGVAGAAMGAAAMGGAMGAGMGAGADGTQVMPGGTVKPVTTQPSNYRSADSGNGRGGRGDDGGRNTKRTVLIVLAIVAVLAIAGGIAFALLGGGGSQAGNPVPNVAGKTVTEATQILEDAGFKLGTTSTKFDSSVAEGKIISQDPAADSKREAGTKVNIVVSQGAEQVAVPDLRNKTVEEAQKLLDAAGLQARAGTAAYSPDVAAGHVISQSPAANEKVAVGSTVEYILSLGTEDVAVPDVRNYSQDQAISTLEASGFKASVQTEYSSSVGEGLVTRQDPSSGAKLEKGSTVTIYVSKGADPADEPIEIPYVIGDTVASATSRLESAGFTVYVAGDTDGTATVTAQNPAASATAKRGTQVTITGKAQDPTPTPTPGGGGTGDKTTS